MTRAEPLRLMFAVAAAGILATAMALAGARPATANFVVDGLYCGTAWSGGRLVEVRTRLTTRTDGLLDGTYEFADNGETTPGTVREYIRRHDRMRTLIWVDKYGTGQATFNFNETGKAFDGLWGILKDKPSFRWDGKRCDVESV